MAADAALVRAIAPELAGESEPRIDIFIEIAEGRNAESVWGDLWEKAVALDACHELTMANRSGAGGPINNQKVGDVSVGYGSFKSGKNDVPYDLTSYGQMYLNLRKTILVTPIVV